VLFVHKKVAKKKQKRSEKSASPPQKSTQNVWELKRANEFGGVSIVSPISAPHELGYLRGVDVVKRRIFVSENT
jgi:hypothetical protein